MRNGLPKEPASLARKGDFKGWAPGASPFRSANKKAATRLVAADRLICGTPIPRRTIAVPTREAYPKHRRVVKKQGDDLDKSGCCGYDLSAGSQGYAVYSACSN